MTKHHNSKPSLKGKGFDQPAKPHERWHVDVSYINIACMYSYLCTLLDGYSRFIVHREIRERMTEADVEVIVQRARERYPDARPRIISDNGPQFIARDFKEFIRICGMTHVRASPYFPQSNGKIERWHKTLRGECIRVKTPLSLECARRIAVEFVQGDLGCSPSFGPLEMEVHNHVLTHVHASRGSSVCRLSSRHMPH